MYSDFGESRIIYSKVYCYKIYAHEALKARVNGKSHRIITETILSLYQLWLDESGAVEHNFLINFYHTTIAQL